MNKVVIFHPYYLPGFRSGGPQQTIINICSAYHEKADIFLLTKNHDLGSSEVYTLPTNKWLKLYDITIKYLPDQDYNFKVFKSLYDEFDILYSCGLFYDNSYKLMLIHRLLNKEGKKLYIAPMGVFNKNAFNSKFLKKRLFALFFSFIGAFKNIIWSFSSIIEFKDAQAIIGAHNIKHYIIAEDLPKKAGFISPDSLKPKQDNELHIIFLSRISRMKNLDQCLRILNFQFIGMVRFDIYGIKEDIEYWNLCWEMATKLPENVTATYRGEILPDNVIETFSQYDIFLFPTKGENFGHVIYESLAAGCVPVISDTTPWKDFNEQQCGKIIELENINRFRDVIQKYLSCPKEDFMQYKKNAIRYAENKYKHSITNSGYKAIFETN